MTNTDIHNALIELKLKMLCRQLGIRELVATLETKHDQTIVYRYADQGDGTPFYQGIEDGMMRGLTKLLNENNLYG